MGPVCGDTCRQTYKVEGREAPCAKCKREPLPGNVEAFMVYGMVQNQVVTAGVGEIVALDFRAIDFVMRLYCIKNRRQIFEKVVSIFNTVRERNKE